ncbi:MAG: DUF4064 domain-containing protein [Bacteroidales bacterium]|nr:DUF4064 domain-containing protein [Bacteroidales bacterium]
MNRTPETILGILGGIFGLLGGIFTLVILSSFEYIISGPGISTLLAGLGVSAILASTVGLTATVYINQKPKAIGIILIISAIWLLISISAFGIIGAILLGIAGIVTLIRK